MVYSAQYSVKEPTLCSQIATKEGLEYLALLQVPATLSLVFAGRLYSD